MFQKKISPATILSNDGNILEITVNGVLVLIYKAKFTKENCQEALRRNTNNRQIDMAHVQAMYGNFFPDNMRVVFFDWDGVLIDSQHFVTLNELYEMELEAVVIEGVNPEMRMYIDSNTKPRTILQRIKMSDLYQHEDEELLRFLSPVHGGAINKMTFAEIRKVYPLIHPYMVVAKKLSLGAPKQLSRSIIWAEIARAAIKYDYKRVEQFARIFKFGKSYDPVHDAAAIICRNTILRDIAECALRGTKAYIGGTGAETLHQLVRRCLYDFLNHEFRATGSVSSNIPEGFNKTEWES